MWWEIPLGFIIAILLTLAFFVLGKSLFSSGYKKERQGEALLIFALAAILLSGLLIVYVFGIGLILKKIAGLILLAFGFFMLVKFPSAADYQPEGFFWLGITIGFFCTFLGVYLLLF